MASDAAHRERVRLKAALSDCRHAIVLVASHAEDFDGLGVAIDHDDLAHR
jgi:hypothetical protein